MARNVKVGLYSLATDVTNPHHARLSLSLSSPRSVSGGRIYFGPQHSVTASLPPKVTTLLKRAFVALVKSPLPAVDSHRKCEAMAIRSHAQHDDLAISPFAPSVTAGPSKYAVHAPPSESFSDPIHSFQFNETCKYLSHQESFQLH